MAESFSYDIKGLTYFDNGNFIYYYISVGNNCSFDDCGIKKGAIGDGEKWLSVPIAF